MIKNILKRRKEIDTYLTHVCRQRWSRKILVKINEMGAFRQHCGFHQLYEYKYLLQFPFSSLLGPNNRLRILFSNTLSLRSSLNVGDHASQPYSTTGNNIPLSLFIVIKYIRVSREFLLIKLHLWCYLYFQESWWQCLCS